VTRARIEVDGVVGSNPPNGTPLVLGATVQLDNDGNGGETTWLWEFMDRPEGSAAVFSDPTIANPTFVADVEGTYLLRLTVNLGLGDEATDTQIAGVAQLLSLQRIPAAGEEVESSATRGWALAANRLLRVLDTIKGEPGLAVYFADTNLARGDVVRISTLGNLRAGLPGATEWASASVATAVGAATGARDSLAVVEGNVDGTTTALAGELVVVRRQGIFGPLTGSPVVGDLVYLSDIGVPDLAPGTEERIIGRVIFLPSGAEYWMTFDGSANASPPTPNTAPFVLDTGTAIPTLPAATLAKALTAALVFEGATGAPNPVVRITKKQAGYVLELVRGNATSPTMLRALTDTGVALFSFGPDGGLVMHRAAAGAATVIADGLGADLTLATVDAQPIRLNTDDTPRWEVEGAGDLAAVGGRRRVKQVQTPAATTDAVPQDYLVDNYGPTVLVFGADGTGVTTDERSLPPGHYAGTAPLTAGSVQPRMRAPQAVRLRRLYVSATTGPVGDSQAFVVYINGIAQPSLTATLAAAGTSADSGAAVSVGVVAGDRIEVRSNPGALIAVGALAVSATLLATRTP
jgi:hypothetical protein